MAKITTVEQALDMVKKRGYALKYLTKELKTAEVCLEAVKNDGGSLNDVPEVLMTKRLQALSI